MAGPDSASTTSFGVFPYFSSAELQDIYLPLTTSLSARLGYRVNFLTETSHKKFIHKLNNEFYDIALIPPFWVPVAMDSKEYLPFLKMSEPFHSSVLVLDKSAIHSIQDLKGKSVATPPTFTPVVHLAIKAFTKNGLVPGKDIALNANETVDECFQQVIDGLSDACVSPPFAHRYYEHKYRIRFRPVMKSGGIPGVALVVHSRVSKAHREVIYDYFANLHKSREGIQLLRSLQTERFIPVVEDEYDIVRNMLKRRQLVH